MCGVSFNSRTLPTQRSSQFLALKSLQQALRPGARVVSYVWPMPGLPPSRTATAVGEGVVLSNGGASPNVLAWEFEDLFPAGGGGGGGEGRDA